jgi:uncharacterized membrane protein
MHVRQCSPPPIPNTGDPDVCMRCLRQYHVASLVVLRLRTRVGLVVLVCVCVCSCVCSCVCVCVYVCV